MQDIKLVTVDVWDTLVRRRCHPDSVKVHVSRFLLFVYHELIKDEFRGVTQLLHARQEAERCIGESRRTAGFDDEYNLHEVYSLWLKKVVSITADHEAIIEALYKCELEQEYYVTYRDPTIESTLNKFGNAKRVFVSDFYMDAKELHSILQHLALDQIVTGGYSSCNLLLNKRSGRIFPYVLQQEGQDSKNVIHIGDNEHSDVNTPKKLGISAIHYLPKEQHALRMILEDEFHKPRLKVERLLSKVSQENNPHSINSNADKMYKAGVFNSPLVVGFMLHVMEELIKNQHEQVFFFTREGEFFKEVYDAIASKNPFGVPVPEAIILEVSRVATFSPSIEEISIKSLMRIWSLYSTQSIQALFSSLDIDIQFFSEKLSEYELSASEEIQYPWLDQRVLSLFDDTSFTSEINSLIAKKRELLTGYLNTKNFPSSGQVAIVDIGWRGTIQDNLAYIFPNLDITGFYLGLDKFINPQPRNTKKSGYIANLNKTISTDSFVFNKVSPIEMLCNSPHGSVVGYQIKDKNYSAKRLIHESENRSYYDAVVYFQKGVVNAAAELGQAIRVHAISSEVLRPMALSCWTGIISKPPAAIAEAYFKLAHNESFGLGRFDDKTQVISSSIWIKSIFSLNGMKTLVRNLEQTGWPEGYLAQRKLSWLWKLITLARQLRSKQR